ncbi:hypothetical protein Ctha_1449 [Chloroherpeton thalassium ATCC 35110]|uniref:Uncharacterized protein n=1 Tax=Chloroherpeton thalassium (strain ATCC 35110 / GB-78) TaxID=517418 RepID=B3QRV5_CHLT3|nr:hypothetical protein [Chloroherpeton thalassium]ACF13908.1 hypothetical protein Ctha_1449 [Chloroherpeton thalassium ATCC 35110]
MKIEFSAKDDAQEWLESLAHQFETTVTNDAIMFSDKIGTGFFKQFYFFEGLTLAGETRYVKGIK